MPPDEPPPPRNAYCERLGIEPPDLVALARRRSVRIRSFVVGAVLERGAPMTLEEIVERLEEIGVTGGAGDLRVSVLKAWHGPPLFRDAEGRFALDPSSLAGLPFDLAMHVYSGPPAPPVVQPSDDVPITTDELREGFSGRHIEGLPLTRQAAAVLEAAGRSMTLEEVEATLSALTPHRWPIRREHASHWNGPLVRLDSSGVLSLLQDPERLRGMRRAVRKVMLPALRAKASVSPSRAEAFARREREEEAEALVLRRAVIHGLFDRDCLAALTVLDEGERTLSTFVEDEVARAASLVRSFDLVVGLEPRRVLDAIGIASGTLRLVDLSRAPKSRRINRQGHVLKVTPAMLMRSSLNLSRPLGDSGRLAGYLARGQRTRLVRRMESDAKALLAYYRYGVLQRGVRLRWGFLDEVIHVEWAQRSDLSVAQILQEAEKGRRVEVVLFTAPGWEEPWACACPVLAVHGTWGAVTACTPSGDRLVSVREIQAARVVE